MELVMRKNGFCKGMELKREPTEDEVVYCLTDILGFDYGNVISDLNVDLKNAEDEEEAEIIKEEIEREKKNVRKAFIGFIKGDCDWEGLSDALYSWGEYNFTIGIFAHLITYLKEKEII